MAAADGPDRFAPPHVRPALRRSAQNIIGQAIKRLPDPTVAVGGGAAGAVTAAAARSDAAAEIDAGAAARTAAPSPVLRLLPAIENEPEAPAGSGAHAPDARSAGAAAASASASAKAFVSATAIDMRCAADLACLIARCHKAPCGKGAATVVDERVRQTLELDADACTVDCGGRLEAEVLPEIKRQLSLQHLNLRAQLHKVLVYRPGDFFKPHRDNLKDPRHHLTLVLDLGAEHQGGEIEFFDAVGLSRRRFRERAERGWLRHTGRLLGLLLRLILNVRSPSQRGAICQGLSTMLQSRAMRPLIPSWPLRRRAVRAAVPGLPGSPQPGTQSARCGMVPVLLPCTTFWPMRWVGVSQVFSSVSAPVGSTGLQTCQCDHLMLTYSTPRYRRETS